MSSVVGLTRSPGGKVFSIDQLLTSHDFHSHRDEAAYYTWSTSFLSFSFVPVEMYNRTSINQKISRFRIHFSYEPHFRFTEIVYVWCFMLTLKKCFRSVGLGLPFQGGFLCIWRLDVLDVFVYFVRCCRTIGWDLPGHESFLLQHPT
jgi:hypothetical protein